MAALVIDLATDSIASDSLRDRLAQAISDAAGHRHPDISGCCHPDLMCCWHEADMAMYWVLRIAGRLVERSAGDEGALRVMRSAAPTVIAEVCGATKDGALIAAVRGGGDRGE